MIRRLTESFDGGASWRFVRGPLDGWGEAAGIVVLDATSWLYTTAQNGLYLTEDSGTTYRRTGPGSNLNLVQSPDGSLFMSSD
jgi:photosystem II stability/assembly factor-like uncharacterized protein